MTKHSTLRDLVDQVCNKIDPERPERYFTRLFGHAKSGLQELGFGGGAGGQSLKTILLDLGPDRIATLPEDYVEWVAVGQEYADKAGTMRVRNLAYGPSVSLTAPIEPFLDPTPLSTPIDPLNWPCYTYWGWAGGELCGYGHGEYRQEFRIDRQENVLRASSLVDATLPLVFQYLSSDATPRTDTPIHPYLHRPLECWINWQWWQYRKDWNAAAIWEKQYKGAVAGMRKRFDPTTREGISEALRTAFRNSPQ